ncbi:MAG TPA: hypothetical protein VFX15_07645 [Actinomycetes bacterium]|nr:hypothetical protein [Actinomycetes bacterium]
MPSSTRALRLPAHLVLLALLLATLPLLLVTTADAAPPKPDTPKFGKAIEGYAPYEGGQFCDPVDTPGAKKLARLIRATYGSDESIGIARNACYTTSEHNDGRALDWMVDATTRAGRAKANAFLDWLLATDGRGNKDAMARRLGVMYIIHNRQIWRAYDGGHWGTYSGTNPHTDHIHISLSYDGSTGRTSFWTGKPLGSSCANGSLTTSAPKVETDPMRYVSVAPTRLASTESGAGMLSGRCRLFHGSGRRVDVQVAGAGPVPGNGVAAVALNVAMRRPNWRSALTAGPAGGDIPSVKRVSAEQNEVSTASMVLPVGADGKVSFFSDFGATDLAVSVVGYYVDPDAPLSVRRQIAADGGDQFDGINPKRVADLTLGRTESRKVAVAGVAGTDPASSSATVSVTVEAGAGHGSLYVYAAGQERPKIPVVTYGKSATTVQTTVPIGRGGSIVVENDGSKSRGVTVDLSGAYEPAALDGGRSLAVRKQPKKVVDTASGLGFSSLGDGASKTLALGDSVPRGAQAVLLQVTAKNAKSAGSLTFWRPGTAKPGTIDLSMRPGRAVTGTVIALVGDGRKVQVKNSGAQAPDLKITVLGSFH